MKRQLVRLLCLAVLVTVSAFGQRGGGFHGGMGGFHGGGFHGGMGGFHGGGFGMHGGFGHGFAGPGFHGGFAHPGFHHGFVGPGFHSFHGNPFFFHQNPFFFNNRFFFGGFPSRSFFGFGLGFGSPGWGWGGWGSPWGGWGGYYGSALYPYPAYGNTSDPTPYTPSPNVTVIYPPNTASDYAEAGGGASEQGTSPSVVINEYKWGSSSNVQTPAKPVHFTIALRNNTVVDALAYWVDGNTLRYVDIQGKQQQVPLSDVDRARSQQLNRDRGIEFGLPQ